ncbi:hypothetical protein GCM10009557_05340 [Virgisporangium ochraceum]|uniref:Uncharacterized protein n=1 Tax=Virgisporangium ochraceum TaxID=65505 RepID=A0A8J3ZQU6_9ACTN|nr:hypothetical protein [Virgisporangium ochraceum]GIJ65871.1 hypothetical protein Voc01_007880 [Virgisporangium ochraceum]
MLPACNRGSPPTTRVLVVAAQLAVPRPVVAGPSAALWYELPVVRPGLWLWTGPNGCGSVAGVRLFRDVLAPGDVGRGDGIPVTAFR